MSEYCCDELKEVIKDKNPGKQSAIERHYGGSRYAIQQHFKAGKLDWCPFCHKKLKEGGEKE